VRKGYKAKYVNGEGRCSRAVVLVSTDRPHSALGRRVALHSMLSVLRRVCHDGLTDHIISSTYASRESVLSAMYPATTFDGIFPGMMK
jgi:hypothetical protein